MTDTLQHSSHAHYASYEQFPPTVERSYTLIVSAGLAYRKDMPQDDGKHWSAAMEILTRSKAVISDRQKWIPTEWELEGGNSVHMVVMKAVDPDGNRINPEAVHKAVKWTLLGALEAEGFHSHSDDAFRVALNALQMAIEGWVSLGHDSDKRRRQEQKDAIVGIDEYIDDDMAREGHSRCVSILDDAIKVLETVKPQ